MRINLFDAAIAVCYLDFIITATDAEQSRPWRACIISCAEGNIKIQNGDTAIMDRIIYVGEHIDKLKNILNILGGDVYIKKAGKYDECVALTEEKSYNLLIINIQHCDEWTLTLPFIRKQSNIPIIIYSAGTREIDAITAFRLGADDYITDSQTEFETALRIRRSIDRYTNFYYRGEQRKELRCGDICIYPSEYAVYKKQRKIELTRTEFDLLCFFVKHKGNVLSREQLCCALWNDEFAVDDTSIVSHIHRLRAKLEDNAAEPEYIITIRGIGYKMTDMIKTLA